MTLTSNYGLSNEQIVRYAPSVGASHAHSSVSERYMDIPTLDVINALRDEGYAFTSVMHQLSRLPDGMLYTKHILRARKQEYLGDRRQVGDEVPEIEIVNSRGAYKAAYRIMAALFRLVCLNGLAVRTDRIGEMRVLHRGNQVAEVISATRQIADHAGEVMSLVAEMKRIELEPAERILFADYAERARYGETVEGSVVHRNPAALLIPQHREDYGKHDLNTTLNVVQEGIMRGGVKVRNGKRARAITSVDETIRINPLLWQFAEELRKLHTGY